MFRIHVKLACSNRLRVAWRHGEPEGSLMPQRLTPPHGLIALGGVI